MSLLLKDYRPACKLAVARNPVTQPRFKAIEGHGHFADLYCPLYGGADWRPADPIELAARLQEQGICRAVNLDGFWDGFLGISLEQVMRATRQPDGFWINFVSVDTRLIDSPGFEAGVRSHLQRARELGFRGIKLFKHVSLMVETDPYVFKPGRGILIDDPRLAVIWQTAADFNWPVLVHIADPEAFFDPVDAANERYLELKAHPDWSYYGQDTYSFAELMQAQQNLLKNNPGTSFIIPHVGSNAENLAFVAACLDRYPNLTVDLAARIDELGRQVHTAGSFCRRYADRIVFGTDVYAKTVSWAYRPYYRVLETADDYIPGSRWPMYGLDLPDDVLKAIYAGNLSRLLGPS